MAACHSFSMLDTQTTEAGDDPVSSSKVALAKTLQTRGNHLGRLHNVVLSSETPKRIWPKIRSLNIHRLAFGNGKFLFLRIINRELQQEIYKGIFLKKKKVTLS